MLLHISIAAVHEDRERDASRADPDSMNAVYNLRHAPAAGFRRQLFIRFEFKTPSR